MILAELSGNVAARGFFSNRSLNGLVQVRGFLALFIGLFLFSLSWDRIDCFPFSTSFIDKWGFLLYPREKCVRIWPMLLPFLSGFLSCYERVSMNWGSIRQLGRKRVRLISLFLTTTILFVPAVLSLIMLDGGKDGVSISNLGWPLANTVVFGVLLSENYSDEKSMSFKDFQREFLVTFVCTIVLELFYFPELSLWGLLFCGFLLYVAVRDLDPVYSSHLELGLESSESVWTVVLKPIRHILSERKSRKIAVFLLINSGYMVVEFVVGFMSNSLGLISDACHMLFDCAALAIGLYASYISRLPANSQFNYGRGRFEVLSGYVNAVFLVLVGALIVLESLERILDPQEISTNSLLTVSIGGLLVNVVGLIFFHEEHHHAHGGSCSHSHHDHHHSHDVVGHDHENHNTVHECITVSHEKSCSDHDVHFHGQHVNTPSSRDYHSMENTKCEDHHLHDCAHHHDLNDHAHHHDHHENAHEHACNDHHHNHNTGHHFHEPLSLISSGSSHRLHSHGHYSDSEQRNLQSSVEESKKKHHSHIDHNMEGIFLHVLADTLGSVGVVISTLLIKYKGWLVSDPACSIFISVLIVSSVIPLLRNSAEILLLRVPRAHEQDLKEALNGVMKKKGIRGIHKLHVWSLTNTDVVGTLHLHVSTEAEKASMKACLSHTLHDAGVNDLTLQVECLK
ncbi:Cation_efflux domain-containing protein [Cephalotus follicularis]|uniref:Cation_efflux domain-containing protein n=1 Tax=Cephalotus follicularis TaxID=3775 RepID=A0A1Q3CL66_CEPFO|nr:Cation_efflux domain-containing protein [Cephalotus follicularis]